MSGRTVKKIKKVKRTIEGRNGSAPEVIEELVEIETTEDLLGISYHMRWIPEKTDHGKLYMNLSYQLHDSLRVGVDYRPLTDDLSLLANWRVWSEEEGRPAFIVGVSNDDFGDVNSYSYYGTLSKHLKSFENIHISGYAGATYIDKLNDLRPVGGLRAVYEDWATTLMYSGTQEHFVLSKSFQNHTVSFVLFNLEKAGLAYSWNF